MVLGFENSTIPDDGSVTIIGDNAFAECKNLKKIELPACITAIEYGAFSSCENLKDIKLPDSVTSIGDNVFYNCSSLESVVIPNKVKSISGYLFMKCSNLKNIVMPNGIKSIGNRAFSDCVSLKDINLPDGVISIGNYAYSGCTSISNITLPNSVVSVGDNLFEGCTDFEKIVFPESLKSVGKCMFVGCTKIKSITVDEKNSKYHSSGNCLIEKAGKILVSGCCNSTIPNDGSVTVIASNSFQGCIGLESIAIPEGVETIKSYAFDNCKNLTNVRLAKSVKWIESYAFNNCDNITIVHYSGTEEQWGYINFGFYNVYLESSKIICSDTPEYQNPFIDIYETEYYYNPVQWAVERKFTNGTTATTFSPHEVCTRGQIVTFLWRAAGSPEPTSQTNTFTDIALDDYYYKAVLWAVENGITKGTSETTFEPNTTCTRGHIVTFLYRDMIK